MCSAVPLLHTGIYRVLATTSWASSSKTLANITNSLSVLLLVLTWDQRVDWMLTRWSYMMKWCNIRLTFNYFSLSLFSQEWFTLVQPPCFTEKKSTWQILQNASFKCSSKNENFPLQDVWNFHKYLFLFKLSILPSVKTVTHWGYGKHLNLCMHSMGTIHLVSS